MVAVTSVLRVMVRVFLMDISVITVGERVHNPMEIIFGKGMSINILEINC